MKEADGRMRGAKVMKGMTDEQRDEEGSDEHVSQCETL